MSKWIAEFDLEDGDTMPEHMDLEYKGTRIDFHCRPLEQEPFKPMVEIDLYSVIKQKYIEREALDKLRAELHETAEMHEDGDYYIRDEWIDEYFDKYKAETENT